MANKRSLSVCEYFRPEAERFIRTEAGHSGANAPGLTVLPANCTGFSGCPYVRHGGPGGIGLSADTANHCSAPLSLGGCLSLIAPEWLLGNLIREGAYLASPAWLSNWRSHIDSWGFDPVGLKEFAGETMRSLCLIDTLTDPESAHQLAECAAALGVPALRIPVGMEHCNAQFRSALGPASNPLSEPRNDADYAMALDLLDDLVRLHTERDVVIHLLTILTMLFAPASLRLVSYDDGSPTTEWNGSGMAGTPDSETLQLCGSIPETIIEHGDGLAVPLDFDGERLAIVVLDGFAVPHGRGQYRNLLEAVAPIFSLSLRNARTHEELVREKTSLKTTLDFRDRLLTIIGHDLRGPIGSISSLLAILSVSLAETIPEEDALSLIELAKAAQNTFALLEDLLEWAGIQTSVAAVSPVRISVQELAEQTCDVLRGQVNAKGIVLVNEVDPDMEVTTDPNSVRAILRNLLSNAVKFTPPSGRIIVRSSQAGDYRRIDVVDTGVGMDATSLALALDPARRYSTGGTDGETGTGLGLLFCQDLATTAGAALTFTSTPGIGTTASLKWSFQP